jgi:putative DNA primase/helicase
VTGLVHEHVLPVLHGVGANGKSTLIGVVQDLLGDHAMTAPDGLVIRHDHEPHPERIVALRGRRLVVSNELERRAMLAEQTVKMLTGGDTLSARELYGRRFNFTPSHKVLLVSNHKPKVRGTDLAIWRRIRLVPFESIIPVEAQDVDLRRSLVEDHGAAVLAWLVRGAVEWHKDGLGSAAAVDAATEDYETTQDIFGAFLSECTVEVPRSRCKVGDLWDVWRRWCDQANERPGKVSDFRLSLEDHNFEIETYQGAKFAKDVGILVSGESQFDLGLSEVGEGP